MTLPPLTREAVTLASQVHAAWWAGAALDEQILNVVTKADPSFDYYEHWTDDYDNSIEFHAIDGYVPTKALADAITGMGFSRFWLNYSNGTESYCGTDPVQKPHPRRSGAPTEPTMTVRRVLAQHAALNGEAGERCEFDEGKYAAAARAMWEGQHGPREDRYPLKWFTEGYLACAKLQHDARDGGR